MTGQTNIITDLSNLIKVPNKVLNELSHKLILCIGNIIVEAKKQGETAVAINIGIGTLGIDLVDMQCKFVPDKTLKSTIKRAATQGIDPLELELEAVLKEKLIRFVEEVI